MHDHSSNSAIKIDHELRVLFGEVPQLKRSRRRSEKGAACADQAEHENGAAEIKLGAVVKPKTFPAFTSFDTPPNIHKRYLVHVAEFNLGILMRALFGYGTPREAASARSTLLFVIQIEIALAIVMIADIDGELAMLVIVVAPDTD